MDSITSRYKTIYDEVNYLANKRSWQDGKIKLIVVTKKKNIEDCLEVVEAGATNLGENYADEAVEKFRNEIHRGVCVHMIGHLQSRKVKLLYPLFSSIQTLDSLEIAEKINRHFGSMGKSIDALIELNLSDQDGKSGFTLHTPLEETEFTRTFQKILNLPSIKLKGLMTMGDFPLHVETNRYIFKRMKSILIDLQDKHKLDDFNELSMGTSGDYQTAIEEGATMVRIGEKIMGNRKG